MTSGNATATPKQSRAYPSVERVGPTKGSLVGTFLCVWVLACRRHDPALVSLVIPAILIFVVSTLHVLEKTWAGRSVLRQRERSSLCDRCGYDRTGLPERSVCPECGADEFAMLDAVEDHPTAQTGSRRLLGVSVLLLLLTPLLAHAELQIGRTVMALLYERRGFSFQAGWDNCLQRELSGTAQMDWIVNQCVLLAPSPLVGLIRHERVALYVLGAWYVVAGALAIAMD